MFNKYAILSAVLGLLMSFTDFSASNSICDNTPTVPEALKKADVVFAGKVIARMKYGVRFKVERSWKGVSKRNVYIYTGNIRNDADPWFRKGERWLVYAANVPLFKSENSATPYTSKLMARACSRTVLLKDSKEDVNQLGVGKPPN